MSKPKQTHNKKYSRWHSREQVNYVFDLHKSLASEVQFYKLKDEIKIFKNLKPDIVNLGDTIDLFNSFSDVNLEKNRTLQSGLRRLCKHDLVMNFQGKNYLYHTYKVLGFIRETLDALMLAKDTKFQKGTIGVYSRHKQTHKSKYKSSRKRVVDPENTSKGSDIIKAVLHKNMYLNESFTKYYLGLIAMFGIDNFKIMQQNTLETKILKNTLKVFMSGKVTKNDCANSLLTVLYFYLHFKMRINAEVALSTARSIVFEFFGISKQYKNSELLQNIYIKEVIGEHIIFGFSTKTPSITVAQKSYYRNKIVQEELVDSKKFPMFIIDESINNPLRLYTLLTPSELLQESV